MTHDGIAKVQHYVPQFLLKHFSIGKKNKVHVFDKQTGKTFFTNVKNIASESRFYDFHFMGKDLSIEERLTSIESSAKPLLKSILDTDSISNLTAKQRADISIFLSVQFTRTKWHREQFREFPRLLAEGLNKKAPNSDYSAIQEYLTEPSENDLAIFTAQAVLQSVQDYSLHFLNKIWFLAAADIKHPFLIGDNPIGMQNMFDMGPYGNIGLAVRGIEIYFPLSPTRALAMWCPSLGELVAQRGNSEDPLLKGMRTGNPVAFLEEHVLNFNSIQIRHAERFVFSCKDDHSLASKMLADNKKYMKGPRSTIN